MAKKYQGLRCSFCGRYDNEVELLMPGTDGCICNECAEQANNIAIEFLNKKKGSSVKDIDIDLNDIPKPQEIMAYFTSIASSSSAEVESLEP